jgi:pantoate kinase
MAKSTRPIIRIHNTETNEVIDREMTVEEFAQHEADQLADLAKQAEADAKAAAKQAIADRLGLTADELKLLLG